MTATCHSRARPREGPAEHAWNSIVAERPAQLVDNRLVRVSGDLSVHYSLEHNSRWRAEPRGRSVGFCRPIERLRRATNESRIDSRFRRYLLKIGRASCRERV